MDCNPKEYGSFECSRSSVVGVMCQDRKSFIIITVLFILSLSLSIKNVLMVISSYLATETQQWQVLY